MTLFATLFAIAVVLALLWIAAFLTLHLFALACRVTRLVIVHVIVPLLLLPIRLLTGLGYVTGYIVTSPLRMAGVGRPDAVAATQMSVRCGVATCRAECPAMASFCRRCGKSLAPTRHAALAAAAMR